MIHSVTKNLAEHSDKLDESTKTEVQAALDDARAVPGTADVDVLKGKVSALSTASMKIGQAMYGKKDAASAPADGAKEPDSSAGASEAEFKEKDKK